MRLPAAFTRLASAPAAVQTGRGDSLFRLAAAWRACPKAEAALSDAAAGPLFEAVTADDAAARGISARPAGPAARPSVHAMRGRSTSR